MKELNKDVRRVPLVTHHRSIDSEGPKPADLKFHISHGLTTPEAEELMRQWGRNEFAPLNATVKRDGCWQNIDASILVPGDLIKLAGGCNIPADCYVNEVRHPR